MPTWLKALLAVALIIVVLVVGVSPVWAAVGPQ